MKNCCKKLLRMAIGMCKSSKLKPDSRDARMYNNGIDTVQKYLEDIQTIKKGVATENDYPATHGKDKKKEQ